MFVGVDEAGKGPVLGSMFAAAVRIPDPERLPADVRDSKTLTSKQREALEASIRADPTCSVAVAEVPVSRIDAPDTDMNTLTVDAQAAAITDIGPDNCRIIVDAADVNADRFARRLADRVGDHEIVAEHKADERHSIVSAASIVAKVARDEHVETLAATYGPVGSGYPSDPQTRSFLEEYVQTHGELPACARRSWETSRDLLAEASQSTIDQF